MTFTLIRMTFLGSLIAAITYTATLLSGQAADWSVDTATDQPTDYNVCEPYTLAHHEAGVAAGTIDSAMWADLMSQGWHGDATDGMEALYSPDC